MSAIDLTVPISEEAVRSLHVGDTVQLSGVIVTGRDAAHKYMVETFIRPSADGGQGAPMVPESERELYQELKRLLSEGAIYHCGPVVRRLPPSRMDVPHPPSQEGAPLPPSREGAPLPPYEGGREGGWEFVAAGPTTSIREEVYEPDVIEHFGLRGVIGKGGMGPHTLRACQEHGAVYLHAVGGAASLIADAVQEVVAVHKKEAFGVPEAFWVIRVKDFPLVVTMDTHGESIHDQVEAASKAALDRLMGV